ncbi:MAG TPA: type II secretion system F family protein [Pirellulales bacterium]|nr:type II secretion system F family protein [Pirellulales bacterium]
MNDEIAALVRAGVPLESGLLGLGADLPGRLGRTVESLGQRMSRGQTLVEALEAERPHLPRLYAAVVAAGVRSGRLGAALEGLAITARQMIELRAMAGAALVYPLIVVSLAYALWIGFVLWIAPAVEPGYRSFEAPSADWLRRFAESGATVAYWGPAIPLAVLIALAVWWRQSGQALTVHSQSAGRFFGWVPGLRRLLFWSQAGAFADVMALLIEQEVPFDEAIVLAAEASGGSKLCDEAQRVAGAVREGRALGDCLALAPSFPPLLAWLIQTGQQRGTLALALRHSAETYRQRARQRGDATRLFLPIVLTAVVGGGTVLLYAVLLFWPWISLLNSISEW